MGQSHSHSNSANNHFREKEKTVESRFSEKPEDSDPSKESKNGTEATAKSEMETLTSRQKFLLRQTWDLGKQDLDSLGFTTFTEVFENHPNLRDIFLSSWNVSQDDLALDDRLLSHGLRVSNIIGQVVDSLDDVAAINTMLAALAKRHITYSVKPEMIPVLCCSGMSNRDAPKKFLYTGSQSKSKRADPDEPRFDFGNNETGRKSNFSITELDKDLLLNMRHNRDGSNQFAKGTFDFTTNQSYYSRYGNINNKRNGADSDVGQRNATDTWSSSTKTYVSNTKVAVSPASKEDDEFW